MADELIEDRDLLKVWRSIDATGVSLNDFAKHWYDLPEADRLALLVSVNKKPSVKKGRRRQD